MAKQRILLVRTDRIGDTILTLPTITALKRALPEVEISFLARSYTVPLLKHYQGIVEIITYHPTENHAGILGHFQLARELKRRRFDCAILFYPRFGLTLSLRLAGIPQIIGSGYRWYSMLLTDPIYEHRKDCKKHEAEYNLALLTPLFSEAPSTVAFEFNLPTELKEQVLHKCNILGIEPTYLIVHPGNGKSAPNLTSVQYTHILQRLLEKTKTSILLTGSPSEREAIQKLEQSVVSPRIFNVVGQFSLEEFMALIAQGKLLITTSTGPVHIANALSVPVLSYYCSAIPHTPIRWGPYHQQSRVITAKIRYKKCQLSKCPYGSTGCLHNLALTGIQNELDYILSELETYW